MIGRVAVAGALGAVAGWALFTAFMLGSTTGEGTAAAAAVSHFGRLGAVLGALFGFLIAVERR